MYRDAPGVGMLAMLPNINPLPCPQGKFATVDGDAQVHRRQSGANMSGHIIITLGSVFEDIIAVRNQAFEEAFEVSPDFRVGILLNQQRSRCVLNVNSSEAVFNA